VEKTSNITDMYNLFMDHMMTLFF